MDRSTVALALALVSASACTGSHDDLGVTTATTTTTGGTGGGGGGTGAGGQPTIVEPDGPPRWTFVNGVVDRDRIALCFLESPRNAADAASPWPAGGLAFARSDAIDLPGAPVPSGTDLELVLVAGPTGDVAAGGCRALADDPSAVPTVDVVSLGVLPEETATKPRSLLFVPTGCLGGAGHEDQDDDLVCGLGYAPDLPTPGLVVAPISRVVDAERVGLQAVHGASGDLLDVYVTPVFAGSSPSLMAPRLVAGQAAPFPPFSPFSIAELGSGSGPTLTTNLANTGVPLDETPFGTALDRGGLTTADVANGKNVAFVGVGAQPGVAPGGGWWHPFAWVAVRPD